MVSFRRIPLLLLWSVLGSSLPSWVSAWSSSSSSTNTNTNTKTKTNGKDRRDFLVQSFVAAGVGVNVNVLGLATPAVAASTITTAASGNLPDLPPDAVRSYLQYRVALQLSADYYLFDLRDKVRETQTWGDISQLFVGSNARGGQGQPNAIERNFVNPMRILGLSMPPDEADELRTIQYEFERAMAKISKATAGVKKDLSVEIPKDAVPTAMAGWEEGRVALNKYFTVVNRATGLTGELKTIPDGTGDAQIVAYGRSYRRYNEMQKKTKLCQNRGGPAISQAWGQLMVSGYLQDSCGIPDMEQYFFQ